MLDHGVCRAVRLQEQERMLLSRCGGDVCVDSLNLDGDILEETISRDCR